jgi:hypothetical protein
MFCKQLLVAAVLIYGAMGSPFPKQHDASTAGQQDLDKGHTNRYIWACPDDKPDLQAGLCYKKCADGYKAVGPVCWKGLKNYGRGAGVPQKQVENPYVHAAPMGDGF